MQLLHFWSRDVHPVQNLLLCTKFHQNQMIFYFGDITIFKMADVHHLGIVLPPYETTHKVSVAGRSCLSNFMSIWSEDIAIWIFHIFGLKCLFTSPKWFFLGTLDHKCDYSSSRPQKAHLCINPRLCKNPLRGLTCRWVDRKCDVTQTHTGKFISCPSIALDRQ